MKRRTCCLPSFFTAGSIGLTRYDTAKKLA